MRHHRRVALQIDRFVLLLNKLTLEAHHFYTLRNIFEVYCCGGHLLKLNFFNANPSKALTFFSLFLGRAIDNLEDCDVIPTLRFKEALIFSFSLFNYLF